MKLRDFIDYDPQNADPYEPYYRIVCPMEDIIKAKRDGLEKKFDELVKKVKIKWFRNDRPLTSRINGNRFDALNGTALILYQYGQSDEGTYTCQVDYSGVPQDLLKYFTLSRGARLPISTSFYMPDIKPYFNHFPSDVFAYRGDNVTLTCKCVPTMSATFTIWFKSCPISKNNTKCLDDFMASADKALAKDDYAPLLPYVYSRDNVETITIKNLSDNDTGYYACVAQNNKGIDLKRSKIDFWDSSARAEQVRQLTGSGSEWMWLSLGFLSFLVVALIIAVSIRIFKSMKRDKKQGAPLISSANEAGLSATKTLESRQRLPNIEAPDIYNTGKLSDGFITGHFTQDAGHLMAQSICSHLLNKDYPSISSSTSHHSDCASSSWGKSISSGGDNSRAFYSPASNATATTVPLYDHPTSSRTIKSSKTFAHSSCVSNPNYWLLNPDHNTTPWSFPRQNLEMRDKIGEGQFGEVWRYIARHKDGTESTVAVKRLKDDISPSAGERSELRAEIEIMKAVNNHPNVIKLLYCCDDDRGPTLLIMEYAEHGKLQTYLRSCRSQRHSYEWIRENHGGRPNITSKELVKFTYHIAKGMEYVASLGIVHRDLASRNILVSKDKICKVADFGFARRVDEECVYVRKSTNPVPVKWMAPEALEGDQFTFKSDVFSLGVLMWEIVTLGATPYEQMSSEGVYKKVTTGGRLERPPHCRDEFFKLMDQCWMHDPALRPTFKEVAEQLEKLLLSENDYIELDQYPEHAYYNIVNGAEKEIVQLST